MSLIGLVFNIVTLPGMFLNNVVQNYYIEKYSVPTERVRTDEIAQALEKEGEIDDEVEDILGELEGGGGEEDSEEYVDFYDIEKYSHAFVVTLMPFFVCSAIGFVILLAAAPLYEVDSNYWLVPFWLGAAFAAHSFPNEVATDALWQKSSDTDSLLRLVGYPIVALSKLVNLLRVLWLDLVYGVVLFFVARYFYLAIF